jgi:hypothetical protein
VKGVSDAGRRKKWDGWGDNTGKEKRWEENSSTYPLTLTRLFLVCHTN